MAYVHPMDIVWIIGIVAVRKIWPRADVLELEDFDSHGDVVQSVVAPRMTACDARTDRRPTSLTARSAHGGEPPAVCPACCFRAVFADSSRIRPT